MVIELKKDTASGLPVIDAGGPELFPRDGATLVLDDERVTAWDYGRLAQRGFGIGRHVR